MEIKNINNREVKDWLLDKHYAKRRCSISYSYGLIHEDNIIGIVTYGIPPSPQVGRGFLGERHRTKVIELNRLCINDDAPKNSASFLVGGTLKKLIDWAVVSYADGKMGHVGYIYQATNFIYCGSATSHDCEYLIDGKWIHPKTLTTKGITSPSQWAKENNIQKRTPSPKHRYIYFVNKKLRKYLKYDILPYPKGETKRYESKTIKRRRKEWGLFDKEQLQLKHKRRKNEQNRITKGSRED